MSDYTNLHKITQESALNLAKFFIKSEKNFLLMGQRGVGKSEICLRAIKECKLKVSYINLSVLERADLGGYPSVFTDSDIITFKSPYYLPKLADKQKPDTVLLFDEVDKCSPETTAPLLEILQFRKINGTPLNIVSCMLTSNLLGEGAYSNIISSALLDRVAKFSLEFDFNQWLEWGKANKVHDLILGFLRSNPELTCGKVDDTCCASPSPRAWTLASEALIKAQDLKLVDIETISQIISGYVGNEAGLKFKVWYQHYRRFEPYIHSLIDSGTTTLLFNELVPTEKLVFVISACHYAKQRLFAETKKARRLTYLENLCHFLIRNKVEPEVQVMGFYHSFPMEDITKYRLYECKVFFELFGRLNEGINFKK